MFATRNLAKPATLAGFATGMALTMSAFGQCPGTDATARVVLLTDDWGGETTWTLVESVSGTTVATGGPYADFLSVDESIAIDSTCCYTFTIFDSYGDGMCCAFGSGFYELYYSDTVTPEFLVGSGGEAFSQESYFFGGPGDCADPCIGNEPVNDVCTTVVPVAIAPGGSATFTGDNTCATTDVGAEVLGPTAWIAFTLSADCSDVVIDYCGTTPAFGNAYLNFFTDCVLTDFQAFDSFDTTTCGDGNVSIFHTQVPAGTYYYAILTEPGAEGPYTINVSTTECSFPTGACCVETVCVATNTEAECLALSPLAEWYIDEDCLDPVEPFVCPTGACCLAGACIGTISALECFQDETALFAAGETCDPPDPFPCPQDGTAHEDCDNAFVIPSVPYLGLWNNVANTADGPSAACQAGGPSDPDVMQNDVWFTYTPAEDCLLLLTVTEQSSFDMVMNIWFGTTCVDAVIYTDPVSGDPLCFDDPEPYTVEVAVFGGFTYWIQIGDFGTTPGGGAFELTLDCIAGVGACCFLDGSCTELDAVECGNQGGVPQGIATSCTPNDCPQPTPGDNCEAPLVVTLPAGLDYVDVNTTCGRGNTYSETCLGSFDGGEDIIYQIDVTSELTAIDFTVDVGDSSWVGMALHNTCPLDPVTCLESATTSGNLATFTADLAVGTYYLMIDSWPLPDCHPEFTLTISQGVPPIDYCAENPDVIYDNGIWTGDNAIRNYRNDDDSNGTTVVDDVTFAEEVVITDLHWYGNEPLTFDWDGTCDYSIYSDIGGGPGILLFNGNVPATRIDTGFIAFGDPIWYYSMVDGINITLAPGTYWINMAPVQQAPYTGVGWWATAADNGTAKYWIDPTNGGTFEQGTADQNDLAFCITSGDGPCDGDLSGDGEVVDFDDLLALFGFWYTAADGPPVGPPYSPGDFNEDGYVNFDDLLALFGFWGPC